VARDEGLATRRQYWFQPNGTTPHTSNNVIGFLEDKFRGRVISRRTDVNWPAHSPDLNPLNYFLWGYAASLVIRRKPTTIPELMEVVEDVIATIPEEMIWKAAMNLPEGCCACLNAERGHFEFKIWQISKSVGYYFIVSNVTNIKIVLALLYNSFVLKLLILSVLELIKG
jgi:hypothetical protein